MRMKLASACSLALTVPSLFAQASSSSPASSLTSQQTSADAPTVLVYHNDDSVKPPRLRPTDFSSLIVGHCKGNASAIVVIELVVDASGKPQNIDRLSSPDDGLERMAVAIAKVDRFEAGLKDGIPVATSIELRISLSICSVDVQDENGKPSTRVRLKSKPDQALFPGPKTSPSRESFSPDGLARQVPTPGVYRVGGSVSAPVPISTPEAVQKGRKVDGVCVMSLIVSEKGLPTNLRLTRGLTDSADQAALDAVSNYRFKPAMNGKQPVPVKMVIEVRFRNY